MNIVILLPNFLKALIFLYALAAALFIILENKSPAKTMAWLLAFLFLPLVGVVIYFIFGRDHHVFSRANKLLQQELGANFAASPVIAKFMTEQPAEIKKLKENGPPIYSRVLELMRRNLQSPLLRYNSLELLQNGTEKYPRLLQDLKAAHHSIHMEYFEWASDALMQEFKQVLLERAKAGVEVRILYDPLGCLTMLSPFYVWAMNAGGVKMLPWSPLYAIHTISYRSHRKIVVIDGQIGYTGGLNMSEEYITGPSNGNYSGWRDTHARVTGEVVLGLQASFAVQWFNTTQEHLTALVYYPAVKELPGYLPLQIVNSGPDAEWKAIRNFYFTLITAAQKRIYIQSPFFILDDGLAAAIAGAARTGIEVKIMLAPHGPGGQYPYWAGLTYAANMAKAGAQIYFYQGDYFHAKTISVDSVICSIGSANMDIRSFAINYELNLIVYDAQTTRQLEAVFDDDLTKCTEFDLAAYQQSNGLIRVRDSLARLLSPLL